MSRPIISINNLSKRYILRHGVDREPLAGPVGNSLRSSVQRRHGRGDASLPLPVRSDQRIEKSDFWALRTSASTSSEGEVVGLIGRNGAGKSTLLKILSRIIEPTTGSIHLRGRVASLLEVGTGFHPELSGRENIYLNGAILGMKRAEIRRKFDEIVAFSEVEQFLDTPVKRYSVGHVRPPGLRRGGPPRAGDPDRRRGARRRRLRVPEEVPRQDARGRLGRRPDRPVRQPQHGAR